MAEGKGDGIRVVPPVRASPDQPSPQDSVTSPRVREGKETHRSNELEWQYRMQTEDTVTVMRQMETRSRELTLASFLALDEQQELQAI